MTLRQFSTDLKTVPAATAWLVGAGSKLEASVGETAEPLGAKAESVRLAVFDRREPFRLSDIEAAGPGVGRDWIRNLLRKMKAAGEITSLEKDPPPGGR